mgnify:CR=1 FL=1
MVQDPLSRFDPLVAEWFRRRYGAPTPIQAEAWPAIAAGAHLLITAPTGSGKTLAAFLWTLNQWLAGRWETGRTHVLYVSPLKALNNDIQRNVRTPLAELREHFAHHGRPFPEIQVLTRSGDTPSAERRRMLRRPPEILITTPESLHLLLSSQGGRSLLGHLRTVVLDEIHAVLASRRGTLLVSGVERLTRLSGEFQRIALSATVQPLATAAGFVGGFQTEGARYVPRQVRVLAPSGAKPYEIAVRVPEVPQGPRDPNDFWDAFAQTIREHLQANRSTLIFANSRRLCEKLTFLINRGQAELLAYAHHGSLAREIRAEVERNLKEGRLKAILATGSLELGIDIGALDEVILVQAPWSVAEAIQRIGRAGHGVGQVSRGTFLTAHAADMVNCAVVARAVAQGDIEPLLPLECPLDVLSQVLLSMLAFDRWHPDDLYAFIRTMAPYQRLSRRQFDLVIDMLAGRYEESRIRELQPRIRHDRLDQRLEARKGALQVLYASGGVIPDRGYYALRHAHTSARIGELDEEFVWEARVGQIFTLGAQNWRIRQIGHNEVRVLPAAPGKPAPPFWRAEVNQRGFHLSEKIGLFLERAEAHIDEKDFAEELMADYALDRPAAQRLIEALRDQRIHTGAPLPHRHHLLMEETALGTGRSAGRQVICHTFWGGRVNRPLAIALEAAWEARFGMAPQIFCTNDTISFLLPPDLSGRELLDLVPPEALEGLVHRRLAQTGFFGARFRECAGRALLLPRRRVGQRMPLWLTRLRAQKLLAAVSGCNDFPILVETWRTCLRDEFDLPRLHGLLLELQAGKIAPSYVRTAFPSPLARGAVWQQVNLHMYQADAAAPEKGGGLSADLLHQVSLSPNLRPMIAVDLAARFQEKRQRLAPGYAPDSADELLDWLKERLVLTLSEWQALCRAAKRDHDLDEDALNASLGTKVVVLRPEGGGNAPAWVAARELLPALRDGLYRPLSRHLEVALLDNTPLPAGEPAKPRRAAADAPLTRAAEQFGQWLRCFGPQPLGAVAEVLGMPVGDLTPLVEALAEADLLIAGRLLKGGTEDQICDRENFEVLLRLGRKAALPDIEARPLAHLALFLARHQGLTRPADRDALPQRLNQLLCWAAPAALWESDILPARLKAYQPEWMDALVQNHEDLRWIGRQGRKVLFCFHAELDLIAPEEKKTPCSQALEDLFPEAEGRYPFSALERASQSSAAALNDRLWGWVWQAKVSNDAFAALRRGVETGFKMPDAHTAVTTTRHPGRPGRSAFQRWRGARPAVGNWFRLIFPEDNDDLLDREELRKDRVRLLLERYGILFRELLARELPMLRWGPLFRSLRLMELSGEVLAGHFFEGIAGLQFIASHTLPDLSRAFHREAIFWLNAQDPASLCGLDLPQLRGRLPRRLPGVHLVYHGERPVIFSHGLGAHLEILVPPDHPHLEACFGFLDHLLTRRVAPLRGIGVQRINQAPAPRQEAYVAVLAKRFDVSVDPKEITLHRRRP